MPKYIVNGKTYNIPDGKVAGFESRYPNATVEYHNEGKTYQIPLSKRNGFLKHFPNASYNATSEQPEKDAAHTVETGTQEVEAPAVTTGETPAVGETPITEQDKIRFSAGLDQIGRRTRQSMDDFNERMDSMREYNEGSKLGFGKTVDGKMQFNPQSGRMEKTYITPLGNRYTSKGLADMESFQYRQAADMSVSAQIRRAKQRLATIDQQLNERGRALMEEHEKNKSTGFSAFMKMAGDAMASGHMGGAMPENPEDYDEFKNDDEYNALRVARRELEKQIRQMENYSEEQQEGQHVGHLFRNMGQQLFNPDSWDFGQGVVKDASTMLSLKSKMDRGEELSDAEQDALYERYMTDVVMGDYQTGTWSKLGDIAGTSVSFMKDFMFTGGGFSSIKLGSKLPSFVAKKAASNLSIDFAKSKGLRLAEDGLFSMVRSGGKTALADLVKEQGRLGVAKIMATRALGVTADELLIRAPFMSATVHGANLSADIIDTKLGRVAVDEENGELSFVDDNSWSEAAWQATADRVIENYSEMFGAHIPGMVDVSKAFGLRNMTAALLRYTRPGAGTVFSKSAEFLSRLGINGYFGEVGEEYYGQAWRTMLDLDSSKDSNGKNLLMSPDFHWDIWGGMLFSIGLTGATTTAGMYGVQKVGNGVMGAAYLHRRHQLNKADARCSEVLTPEEWEGIRLSIDNSDNSDIVPLARYYANDRSLTDEQRSAVMGYIERLLVMRGHNFAELMAQRTGEHGGVQDDQVSQSYMDGYNMTSSQEMNDAKNMMEYQRERLYGLLGDEFISRCDDDPIGVLHEMMSGDDMDKLDVDAVIDYINAKQVYDGMIQRVRDDIDGMISQSDAMIDSRTNRQSGMIHHATMKQDDRDVYVVSGRVVMYPDGTVVDLDASDESVIIRDAVSRKLEQVSPKSILHVDGAVDPKEEKDNAAFNIRQQMAQQAADKADGVATFNPGDTYTITADDGEIQVQVVANDEGVVDNGDGTVNVSDGVNIFPLAKETIQQQVKAAQLARVAQFEEQRAAENEAYQQAVGGDEGSTGGDNMAVNGDNATQSSGSEDLTIPAMQRIPKDEKGNPLYEQTDSDTAWDAIVEQADGDETMAQSVADGMVADKEAVLNKLEKAKSKGGSTVAEKIASEKERKAAIDAAQHELNIWKQIAGTANRRKMEAEEERRRIADEAEAIRKAEEELLRAEREEKERIEREALNGVPDMVDDTPQDARARGYRRVSGHRIDRQNTLQAVQGKEVAVRFSDDVIANGRVAVIDAYQLQPSHIKGVRNPLHFIDEAQPKERNDEASVLSARKIAGNVRPEEITSSVTAYTGAPTVNARGEAIQGNNRSDALRQMWESHQEQAAKYKQYLIDHAEDFGLNADDVAAMERPVLVNMLDVDDAGAITLGQFVAQDTESGGTERIKPKNALQRMGNDMRSFARLLLKSADDETSFAGLVDNNGVEVLKWMSQRGYITPTQYKSAFDSNGNLTAEAKNDLRGIMYQSIFKGGSTRLEEMFNAMPAKAQKAILATAFRDFDSPAEERMIEEIQNSIRAYYMLSQSADFVKAKTFKDARLAVEAWKIQYQIDDVTGESYLPAENFSNFALLLATMYKGENQSIIQGTFNKLYDLIQGTQEPTLFEQPDNTPRTLEQAIKETLNITYDGQRRSNVLAGNSPASQRWQQGSTGDAATGERVESGDRTADSEGIIEGYSRGIRIEQENRGNQGEETQIPQTEEVIGRSLSADEAHDFIADMELIADVAPKIDLTIENWDALFGESGIVNTPIGEVKMGENQFAKLMRQGRDGKLGMIKPTLENPHAIVEEASEAKDGDTTERASSYIFIRSFKKADGSRFYYFTSITVSKDGREVVVSSQEKSRNKILRLLQEGSVIWRTPKDATTSSAERQGLDYEQPNEAETATKGSGITPQITSSDSKDTTNSPTTNELGEKNDVPSVQEQVQAAEAEVNTNPTDGQKEAGNYKKGHVRIDGFDVSIEQPKGSVRRGTDADGKQWSVTMSNTYGYIRGTEGVDGDHIDVFFSDDPSQGDVFVVDQVNRDGSFDEHKVMYGFPDIESARKAYLSNYEEGWQGLGAITPVSKEEFKKWIDSSHRKTKPFAEYKSVKTTEGQNAPADKDLRRKLADFNVGDVVRDYYNQKLYRIKKHSKNGVSTIAELDADGNEVGTTTMNTYNNSRYSLAEAHVKAETPTISQDSEQVSDQDNAPYTIAPAQYTTKKGKVLDMHLVTFGRELSKEEIRAGKELAKESHGWWDREKAGFMMRDEESAKALAEALSNEEAVQDAQPISVGDITAASNEYAVIEKPETWVGKTFYTNGMQLKCTDVSNGYATFDNLTTFMGMGFDVHTVQNYMRSGEWAVVSSKTNETDHKQENKQEKKSETKDVQPQQEEKKANSKWVNDEDAERFEELRKRLKAKFRGQMNMGVDPEIFAIGVEMSYLMLKKGARKFGEFANNLIEALGDEVRPYIKAFYNGARDLPEMSEYEKDMTPYDEVRAFDVMNFDKQGAKDVFATAEHVVREQAAEREAKEATNKLKRKRNARRKETEQIGDVELVASSLPEDQEILRASRNNSGKKGSPVQGDLFGDSSSEQNRSEQDKPSHRFFLKYVGDTIQLRRYTMMPNGMPIEDARTVASANSEREMLDIINNPANRFGNEIDDVRRDLVAAIEEKVRSSAANMQGKEAVNKEEGVTLHRRTKAEGAFSDEVAKRMKAALTSGEKPFRSIVDLRKLAIECGMAVDSEGRDDILIQELVEDGLAKVGREIAGKARRSAVFKRGSSFFPKDVFEQICRLYEMQPTIGQRSSNRIKMQQYSTPLPMGFVADMFVDERGKIAGDEMILEPTAGNGLLVYAVPSAKIHVNELDEVRYENLSLGGYREVSKQDATLPFDGGRRYAGVISNPPFGRADAKMYDGTEISSLEAQIALNALESMKDNGRAAIIVGGNMEYQPNGAIKGADRSFYSYLYDHYNVKGVVDMDGSLYRKQGTTYPTRMILIEGRRSDEERAQERVYPPVRDKAVRKAMSFDELYDIVNGLLNSNEKTNGTAVLRREQGLGSDSESRPGNRDNRSDHQQPQTNDRERGGLERGGSVVQGGLQQGQPSVLGERGRDSGTGRTGRGAYEGRRGDERNAGRGVLAQDDKRVGNGTPGRSGVGLTSGTSSTANEDGRDSGVSSGGSRSSNVSQPSSGSNVTIERRRTLTDEKTLYRPHSKAFSLESVAPAAMTDAMDDALKRIEDEVGDIDGFVQQELGYDSVESLHNALAAEQVDSVAMAIYQMKRGEAMIIGDQTGVGKGRQMAALIRWAVRQGKKPVFITQKADLFSDLYRDLVDIGSGELRPFIFNSDGDIKDSKNQTVYKPLSNERMRSVLRGDALPDGYDFVVLTYSQLNKGDDISRREAEELAKKSGKRVQKKKKDKEGVVVSPKNEFLRRLAKDNFILLDESHTAAGDGNTGSYLQSITRIVKAATFASATFAKRPDTMPLYAIRTAMSKANVESSKLIQIIEKGGVTLQEIMSRALSAVGQMVRRERDMSDVRTDWKTVDDAEIVERAKRNYDKTVKAFNAIIRFQKEFVDPYIEMISESMAAQMKSASKTRGTDKLGLNNVPFASKAYNYTKQLLLALKVDAIVDEVDREIKAGRHPVIALESTMESVLDGYNPGEVLDNATFGASLMKGLEGTLTYTVKDEKNKEVKHVIPLESLPAQAAQAYEEVKQLIRESTGEVFVSPIDEIVMKLNAKGYSVGELTGRDKYVSMEDGRAVVRKRADKDKKRMTMDFNSGKTDVLILNKSASTGISLHASKRFSDQRQRTMVMAQPLSDINDYMQMIGRIDRTGQVHRGYYINLGLPVPAENRFMMMLSTKLKSLNANTTTSQDSSQNDVDAPDLLNKYGSQVIVEYLRDHPGMHEKMGSPLNLKENQNLEDYVPQEDDARKVTGYVALLSVKEQEEFYAEVVERYNTLINYLNETDNNDLKISVMPLRAKTVSRKVASKGNESNGLNPFAQDSYVEQVEMDVLRKPYKMDEVKKLFDQLNKGMRPAEFIDSVVQKLHDETQAKIAAEDERFEQEIAGLEHEVELRTEKIRQQKKLSDEDKAKAVDEERAKLIERMNRAHARNLETINGNESKVQSALNRFSIGKSYLIPDVMGTELFTCSSPGILVGFKLKDNGITPSTSFAVFAVLDGRRRIEVKLGDTKSLDTIYKHTVQNYDRAQMVNPSNWDSQIPQTTRTGGYILTGNIIQAFSDSQGKEGGFAGKLVSYTDVDGNIHDGILMPQSWTPKMMKNAGVPINARQAAIERGDVLTSIDNGVRLERPNRWSSYYVLSVPKSKKQGGAYYLNDELLSLVDRDGFQQRGNVMRAHIDGKDNLKRVLDLLSQMGVRVDDASDTDVNGENDEDLMFREGDESDSIEAVNRRFNKRLDELIKDPNQSNRILHLGTPGQFLTDGGISNVEILLDFDKLVRKSREEYRNNHPFDISDVKDLPVYINDPIAVFDNTNGMDSGRVILTEMEKDGRNFIVAVRATEQKRKGGFVLEVNEITTIYPKEEKGIVKWMIDGNATNINKQKALRFIEALQPHVGTTITSEELSDAAKVVESFENPRVDDKKIFDGEEDDEHLYRIVDDKSTVERLEAEPKMKAYRAMQVIDGRLYSPMAAKVDGKLSSDNPFDTWTEAEETTFDFTPEQIAAMEKLDKSDKTGEVEIIKGKLRYRKDSKTGRGTLQFHLVKGDGTDLWAAYNPYIHSSLMMLNDQFTSAYKRPNIVVVEVEIPESELTSGYRAKLAKDAVGMAEWKAGPVAGQLPSDMGRKVMLSRWSKVKRIVPYSEVADHVAAVLSTAEQKKGNKLRLPIDSFHPELRKELEKRGFEFEYGLYTKGKTDKKGNYIKAWDERSEEEKQKEYKGATYMDDAAIEQLNEEFKGKWMRREGDGPIDDDSLAYENDPISKVLGKSRFSRKQRKAFAERERSRMVDTVKRLAEKLHLDNVEIVTDVSTLDGNKQRAKGFYNRKTGKITIVIPNNMNTFDVEQTMLHEAVAHYGLRKLFGEHFDTFLDNVFENADYDVHRRIVSLSTKYGWDFRKATEEYLASLAENTEFEHTHASWWGQIKQLFLQMLHKIGFEDFTGVTLSDNELRYILWRSYENLKDPGKYRSIFSEAADVAKQYELGVGNYADTPSGSHSVADIDDDVFFRAGDPEMHERVLARDRYEQRVNSGMFQSREALQDSMLALKEAMQAIVGKKIDIEDVDGFENAYLGENRLSSVNKAEADAFAHTLFKSMLDEVAKLARTEDEREELTDYMMAKHGLERNAYMRNEAINNGATDADQTDYAGLTALTGMDDVADAEAEADRMVADYEQAHYTGELWKRVNAVSKAILQKSYDCGMMSRETFDRISGMYEFYIPLRGFDEKTSAEAYAYLTNKHSAFNAPIKTARGRKSKADDPFAYLQSMAEGAIMQGNRNMLVKQRFLNFVLNHPSDLVSVSEIWLAYDAVTDEWKPVFPDNIESTDTPKEVEQKMQDFEERMKALKQQNPDQYKRGKDAVGIPYRVVDNQDLRQHQVVVRRGGRDYVITINGNPRLAQALKGQTNPDNDMSGAIGAILRAGENINRQLSAFYTTRNPDFVVSNFIRDMLYANSMVWVKESPNYALRFHRNCSMLNPAAMKILLSKYRKGTLDMSNKTEAMFHQFMMNGGETGYANLRDIEQHKNDIRKELKRANGKLKLSRALSLLDEKFDELNRAVENCARFAAFVTSREMGRSIDRSIYDAKEISVNFNKKGSGAKFLNKTGQTKLGNSIAFVSGLGRSGYVFWNAAIQGTTNFGRQMKRHPAKAFTAAAVMFIMGALVASLGGDDDDDDDKNAYYNLPEWVRRSNILFRAGDSWISIPLPVEYRAFYGMGELMTSVFSGKEHLTGGEIAEAILGQATQVLPIDFLDGGGGWNAFIPSVGKPFSEAYIFKKSWTGMPIYKDTPYNQEMPEWTKAYSSANKHIVNLAALLNETTGGDPYAKGAIDFNPAKIEYMLNGYFSGVFKTIDKLTKTAETIAGEREYDPRSILLWNRLVKAGDERTEYRAVNKEYFRLKEEHDRLKNRLRHYEEDTDNGIFDYAEKIDFLYNSPEYERYEIFEDYRKDIDALYDEMQETVDDEERKEIEAELNELKKEMIDEVNKTRKRK